MQSDNEASHEVGESSLGRRVAKVLHSGRSTRDVAIVEGVTRLAPRPARKMLDIGCSDGRIAAAVAAAVGADATGVDVQLQDDVAIDARAYDGRTLPFADGLFDLVTIVDVLHHADDAAAVLREAVRVIAPSGRIVIKDHVRKGPWSNWILGRMDNLSNYGVHEITAGSYLSMPEWFAMFADAGATVDLLETPFRVHGLPWRLVAHDSYHLMVSLRRSS